MNKTFVEVRGTRLALQVLCNQRLRCNTARRNKNIKTSRTAYNIIQYEVP